MITPEQVKAIEALHDPNHYMAKFCVNPKAWYYEAMRIACELGLRGGGVTTKRILDIGGGFGYFAMACQDLGHDVINLDRVEQPIDRANGILGVAYWGCKIAAYSPLPENLGTFDLVTMFGVNFRHGDDEYWNATDYRHLAQDVRSRLNPGGRWVVRPNQTEDKSSAIIFLMDPVWWQGVADPDAAITITEYEVEIRWPQST